ncbi:MAG: HAD-IA family hydrolase [Methylococcaceae bacterium]|nr:HAD-IA family hydrolase [Methylococcaceae bacterium]
MNNRFDLLIFDWDGTLINTIDWITHCLQTAAERCGCRIPEQQAAKDVIGLSIQEATSTLHPNVDAKTHEQLVQHYSQEYLSKQLSRADLFPDTYEMLVELKQAGYSLAVATGKTRHGLQAALQATGTEALFDITRCADETASKPNPKMLLEIMQVTNHPPERSLMVGDSIHDLQMAANALISSIGVCCGAHSKDTLQHYKPLLCLTHATELLAYLR